MIFEPIAVITVDGQCVRGIRDDKETSLSDSIEILNKFLLPLFTILFHAFETW